MTSSKFTYDLPPGPPSYFVKEGDIEDDFVEKLVSLKYTHPDIRTRAELEANFRAKFQQLNAVTLSDSEFARLLDQITSPDVYKSAETLRTRNSFERDDGTPLNFTLVNIKDWCKNDFEVVNQLRINTQSSHHRYDVILLINGIPCAQVELKTLDISPRRAMQQIVDYKADPGNGYTNSLLAFMQLFIVSNRTNTYYFAAYASERVASPTILEKLLTPISTARKKNATPAAWAWMRSLGTTTTSTSPATSAPPSLSRSLTWAKPTQQSSKLTKTFAR